MKANAPSQIYLQVCGDCNDNDCKNCKFEDVEDNVTWCKDKVFENDIEYVRTDAFIEKAYEWIENNMLSSNQHYKSRLFYKQFVDYLKGE